MKRIYTFFAVLFLVSLGNNIYSQEMIVDGDMESADNWTIVDLAVGNGHTETFAYTDDTPLGGTDGCLSLAGNGNWSNVAVCQEIIVQKGVEYQISMVVKTSIILDIESDWVEIVVVPEMPVEDSDITSYPNIFALNSWDCSDVLFVDGNFADNNCDAKSELNDLIYYEGSGDTTVVLVLKAGGSNEYNILLDNVSVLGTEVAVEEAASTAKFNYVYPNPASDQIRISYVNVNEIQIFDVIGKEVFSTSSVSDEMTIDISDFANGMYFVRTGEATSLIIKQ